LIEEDTRKLIETWKPKSGRLDRLVLEDKSGFDPKMRMNIDVRADVTESTFIRSGVGCRNHLY